MQFMQFIYGVATSTEVAYYTYIYAKVVFASAFILDLNNELNNFLFFKILIHI
jgi:hypothetical protein